LEEEGICLELKLETVVLTFPYIYIFFFRRKRHILSVDEVQF
jgi:hypothetical protein